MRMRAGGLPRGMGLAVALIAACCVPDARVSIVAAAWEAEPSRPAVVGQGPFGDFDDEEDYPGPDQLRSILGEVPGQPYDISEKKKSNRPVSHICGLFRLNVPWAADVALRLSLWDPDRLHLHLCQRPKGGHAAVVSPDVPDLGGIRHHTRRRPGAAFRARALGTRTVDDIAAWARAPSRSTTATETSRSPGATSNC